MKAQPRQTPLSKHVSVFLDAKITVIRADRLLARDAAPVDDLDDMIKSIESAKVLDEKTAKEDPVKPSTKIEIQPGMSRNELIKTFGNPLKSIVFGNKEILKYQHFIVELNEYKVVDLKMKK